MELDSLIQPADTKIVLVVMDGLGGFADAEHAYRRGFEAAQHPETRGQSYEAVRERLRNIYPDVYEEESFRRGYDRGSAHYSRLSDSSEVVEDKPARGRPS